jgi:hypothetical protein
MSETSPQPPDPNIPPEAEYWHQNPDWDTEVTDDAYRRLVSDSYTHQPDNVAEQQEAVAIIRANALADPEYYGAAAAAAWEAAAQERGHNFVATSDPDRQTAGVNENLREALRVPVPRLPEHPLDTSSPELTEQEKQDFNKLLDTITATASERYGYRAADQRAKKRKLETGDDDEVTDQEDRYWNGYTSKQGFKPGKLDKLADMLAEKLEANPRYRGLLEDRQRLLDGHTNDAVTNRGKQSERVDLMRGRADVAIADHEDASYDGEPVEFHPDPKKHGSWYARRQRKHERLDEWWEHDPTAPPEGIAGIRPSRKREKIMHEDYAHLLIGEGERDLYGKSTGYTKTVPSRESENWRLERSYRRAHATLHLGQAAMELDVADRVLDKSRIRYDTLLEVLDAADQRTAFAEFMQKSDRSPEEYADSMETTHADAFRNFLETNSLSNEDDHAMFVELTALAGYVDDLDKTIDSLDRTRQLSSYINLASLRNYMAGLYNRSRHQREQVRIGAASTNGANWDDGYYGQYGSRYRSDRGVILEDGSDTILYPDGSYAKSSGRGIVIDRRNPDGTTWTTPHETGNGELDIDEDMPLDDLRAQQRAALMMWFFNQEDPQAAYMARQYTDILAVRLSDLAEDTDDNHLRIEAHKASYWESYMYLRTDESAAHHDVQLNYDGSIVEEDTFYGIDGLWTVYPDGTVILNEQDEHGNWHYTQRFDAQGNEL